MKNLGKLVLIISIGIMSCEKLNMVGRSYQKSIKFSNSTTHKIEVISYPKTINSRNNSFIIKAEQTLIPFQFENYRIFDTKLGVINLGFVSFNPDGNYVDSLIVIYDDTIKIKHNSRKEEKAITNITFWNSRNITNGQNYKIVKLCDTKHDFEAVYNFTFIEQDYLEAKAKQNKPQGVTDVQIDNLILYY